MCGTSRVRPGTDGLARCGVALACIVYSLESLGASALPRLFVYAMVGLGALSATAYLAYASRVANPILEMRLFRAQTFSVATLGGFFMRLKLGATPFLLALLFQRMPLKERLLTAVISAFVAVTACRWLVERWDALAKAEWPAIQPAAAALWIALLAALALLAWTLLASAALWRRLWTVAVLRLRAGLQRNR